MDYNTIKNKVPDFFCIKNLRDIFKHSEYNFDISFVDFLMCIEDFYTFVYSTRLSRTSWLLFTWLRTLVRYDGYVQLSYKDVSNKFCENKNVISKPTFFKCIDELDSYGLIKKISNKKLFDSKFQKDTNTYIVISKVDEILPLLEELSSQEEFYSVLKERYFNADIKKKKAKKKIQTSENTKEYTFEYVMEEYKEVNKEINDFFTFLGSNNKSGKIAKSRQTKILNVIRNIYPTDEDLVYAISQTISKGVKSEKYFYAILRNMYYDDSVKKVDDNEVDKALKQKYKSNNSSINGYSISDEKYEEYKDIILTKKGGYLTVLTELKKCGKLDSKAQKLYDVCCRLEKKFKILKYYEQFRGKRIGIFINKGINEHVVYDKCWNEYIHWTYSDNSLVPLNVIQKIANKHKEAFVFSKMQYINERIYGNEK